MFVNWGGELLIIVLFVVFCLALFIAFSSSHKYDFEDVVKYKGKTYGLLEYNGDCGLISKVCFFGICSISINYSQRSMKLKNIHSMEKIQ